MSTSKKYIEYVMERLSLAEQMELRPMMGEYVLYCKGKVIGGVYDDRLLLKITKAGEEFLPNAEKQLPYPGGKAMLLVRELSDKLFLKELCEKTADELPMPKTKKNRTR